MFDSRASLLRAGDPAQVYGGKIQIPGFPAGTPGTPPVAANPFVPGAYPNVAYVPVATPDPSGVQVKAHTWGGR